MFWDPNGLETYSFTYISIKGEGDKVIYIEEDEIDNMINNKPFRYRVSTPALLPNFSFMRTQRLHRSIKVSDKWEALKFARFELGATAFGGEYRPKITIPDWFPVINNKFPASYIENIGWTVVGRTREYDFSGLFHPAADNYAVFLSGSAPEEPGSSHRFLRAVDFDPEWLMRDPKISKAHDENLKNFIQELWRLKNKNGLTGKNFIELSESPVLYEEGWSTEPFFWAAGSSNLRSKAYLNVSVTKKGILAKGYILNLWHDIYDWEPMYDSEGNRIEKSTLVPMTGKYLHQRHEIDDSAWRKLQCVSECKAAPFRMKSLWRENLTIFLGRNGEIEITIHDNFITKD
ncbi:hypothetical protein APED_18370 [Acanthopleuribacter pedis]